MAGKHPPKPTDRPPAPRFKSREGQKQRPADPLAHIELRDDQTTVPEVSLTQQKLIGRTIVVWAKLEAAVHDTIWHILNIGPEDGRLLTSRNDIEDNLILLEGLAKRHLTDERFASLKTVIRSIRARQEDRNLIAHGAWGTIKPENTPIALGLRRKTKPERVYGEAFPSDRMHQIVADIADALNALIKLAAELSASPDKQPRRPPKPTPNPDAGR